MTLRLYDTAARAVREFTPLVPGQVAVYLCGATVQAPPHIGHVRSAVSFDVMIRWLRARGYSVTFCRNVTDIDDKILAVSAISGSPWWAVAEQNMRAFAGAYDALGCLPPDVEPRATGHIPEQIALIRRLTERGHAYAADGDVYFDVCSYPGYGALSGQRLEQMRPADDSAGAGKRDPRDFTLWKGARPDEPSWETPWGPGRPGWHLECSAMAMRYLGETFDIHAGGLDLLFPHHENEQAQSRAAGYGFARYWLHNGLVGIAGEKMSKSLGNSLIVTEMLDQVRPAELRYYLGQFHYRSPIEFSPDALSEAVAAYGRIEGFLTRAAELCADVAGPDGVTGQAGVAGVSGQAGVAGVSGQAGVAGVSGQAGAAGVTSQASAPGMTAQAGSAAAEPEPGGVPLAFAAALDDDLGVPQALAVVHAELGAGNRAMAAGDRGAVAASAARLRAMLAVLGLDPLSAQWRRAGDDGDLRAVVDALVRVALAQRQAARQRHDYAAADAIRDDLKAAGVLIEDTPAGPRWELRR